MGKQSLLLKFSDVLSSRTVGQFYSMTNGQLSRYNLAVSPSGIEHLLSFVPRGSAVSRDGYFEYLTPRALLHNLDLNYRRRVWGSGAMSISSGLACDKVYTCAEMIKKMRTIRRDIFITMERNIIDVDKLVLKETRILVYTNSSPSLVAYDKLPEVNCIPIEKFHFTKDDIIQYSLISSNPHKIHFDKSYAKEIEGYDDIIVPGPFSLQIMVIILQRYLNLTGPFNNFKYRHINYIYPNTTVEICGDPKRRQFWMRDLNEKTKIYMTLNC